MCGRILQKGVWVLLEDFFAQRLAGLRGNMKVSAREMSLAIGQNRNYINQIENKKTFPTMQIFFYICDYLKVTPKEFFDDGAKNPAQLNELIEDLRKLDDNALSSVTAVVKEILRK
jgi:transcriptional regulator with XRE-family HTH domain